MVARLCQPSIRKLVSLTIFLLATLSLYGWYSDSPLKYIQENHGSNNQPQDVAGQKQPKAKDENPEFTRTLKAHADENGYIILASVDSGYVDMALNLFESSLKKLQLNNYLFVTSDAEASRVFDQRNISNFNYFDDKEAHKSSSYDTAGFARKTHYKTKIILDALKIGLTVLITDVDIVILKNPFPFMDCRECDLQITSDSGGVGNSGFYLVRPTTAGIELHQRAWDNSLANPKKSNQRQLHDVIKKLASEKKLQHKTLGLGLFPCGRTYFEEGHRMFAGDNPCANCVMVHDNWIVSGDAKIYRFKEHLMWYVDSNSYYTDPNHKYLSFDNPLDFGAKDNAEQEKQALRTALWMGHLLNRTIILPQFHCGACQYSFCKKTPKWCSLNALYKMTEFNKAFGGVYREHFFLQHELVPANVKTSLSDVFLVDSVLATEKIGTVIDVARFTPAKKVATEGEIIEWFGGNEIAEQSVLRFHSLYGDFAAPTDASLKKKLDIGFKKSTYRQYK